MIEALFAAWVATGIIVWMIVPENKFGLGDFIIALPVVILLWPRVVHVLISNRARKP